MLSVGHDCPCSICDINCDALAGDSTKWPVLLTGVLTPGTTNYYHQGCLVKLVRETLGKTNDK